MPVRPRIQPPRTFSFPLGGGLDVVSPQLSLKPGFAIGGINYIPLSSGGYERVGGYERFDGRPKPSGASYLVLVASAALHADAAVGATLTGASSGATGVIVYVSGDRTWLAVTKVTGTFGAAENLRVGAQVVGTRTAGAAPITRRIENAIYKAAADVYRALIAAVPGSGGVVGLSALGATVYAWRNNAGGTAVDIYKSTSGGWTQVTLGRELAFTSGGTTAIAEGNTITGATSGATAVVKRIVLSSGSWAGGDAAGRLIVASQTGNFAAENLNVGAATNLATVAGNSTAITLAPGGTFIFDVYNFTGSADTTRIYGCDGVNRGFEFDGTTLVPISTGMAVDAPNYVKCHNGHLFFAFRGSVQFSAITTPYSWSPIFGAGEIGASDVVVGMLSVRGSETAHALMVFCRNRTWILYGTSGGDFAMVPWTMQAGALPGTIQQIGQPVFLDDIGISIAPATQDYGNFSASTISEPIRPLLDRKKNLAVASTVSRGKNHYKLFFSDGTGLTVAFRGTKSAGMLPFSLPITVTCALNTELGGNETILVGASNGMVYELDVGRSFDGAQIEHYVRLAYNHCGSPQRHKRFMAATLECRSRSGATLSITPEFSFASTDLPVGMSQSVEVSGEGARWDEMSWDSFFWDEADFTPARVPIRGVGVNASLNIYGRTDSELPHALYSATVEYQLLRMAR